MNELIEEAKQYINVIPQNKKDIFLQLCSLNLLNALIKKKEYKTFVSYGFIKSHVSKLVDFCISHINEDYVEELYYDTIQRCVYIRCYGIQFSFHNIVQTNSINNFIESTENVYVEWDGIRLQPIADKLYTLAKDLNVDKISSIQFTERIKEIL